MSSTLRQHLPQESLLEASPSPLASRGAEALRLGDFKQAIELFRRLVKQDGRPGRIIAAGPPLQYRYPIGEIYSVFNAVCNKQ